MIGTRGPDGRRRGFTLIELLIVIGIIGIVASVTIVALNPQKQLCDARNAERRSHVNSLTKAMQQYLIGTYQTPGGNDVPTGEANAKPVCNAGISGGASCVNLDVLVPDYLTALPTDVDETDPDVTGYAVYKDSVGRQFSVALHIDASCGQAPASEAGGADGATGGAGGSEGSSSVSSSSSSAPVACVVADDCPPPQIACSICFIQPDESCAQTCGSIDTDCVDGVCVYEDLPGVYQACAPEECDSSSSVGSQDSSSSGAGSSESSSSSVSSEIPSSESSSSDSSAFPGCPSGSVCMNEMSCAETGEGFDWTNGVQETTEYCEGILGEPGGCCIVGASSSSSGE